MASSPFANTAATGAFNLPEEDAPNTFETDASLRGWFVADRAKADDAGDRAKADDAGDRAEADDADDRAKPDDADGRAKPDDTQTLQQPE